MNPEEYLDRLIERREQGKAQIPVSNYETAASLAAAETLTQLQKIDVPREFAGNLELQIRARARGLAQLNGTTIPLARPQSPAQLNGTTIPLARPQSPAQLNGTTMSLARPQSPAGTQRFLVHRGWIAALGIAAVLMLTCVGVLTASAQSLPGDALYSLKQAEYQFTLTLANNPKDGVSVQIAQLQSTLVDLSTVVNASRDDDSIRLALHIVAAKTNDSRSAVTALPAGTEREIAQRSLDGVLAEEDQVLRRLLNHVDWPIRLALTQQLGVLGDPVPTVTHVMVSTQSNGTLLITLAGTHFAPNTELIIDGRPVVMMRQSTSEQLLAVISNSAWSADENTFGVRNPDGTAAQMILDGDGHEHPNGDNKSNSTPAPNDNKNKNSTPVPGGDSGD
jgi:hypothetical protein